MTLMERLRSSSSDVNKKKAALLSALVEGPLSKGNAGSTYNIAGASNASELAARRELKQRGSVPGGSRTGARGGAASTSTSGRGSGSSGGGAGVGASFAGLADSLRIGGSLAERGLEDAESSTDVDGTQIVGGSSVLRSRRSGKAISAASGASTAALGPSAAAAMDWDGAVTSQYSAYAASTVSERLAARAAAKRRTDRFLLPALFFPTERSLQYLDGSLPGDAGFDPLGFFDPANPANSAGGGAGADQRWLQTSEVLHARWAMLGVVGCLAPEVLANAGVLPPEAGVLWFRTGWLPQAMTGHAVAGAVVDGAAGAAAAWPYALSPRQLLAAHLVVLGVAEGLRLKEYVTPRSVTRFKFGGRTFDAGVSRAAAYPGGRLFNPSRLITSRSALSEYQDIEISQGRIAMLAFVGFAAQAAATGDGPYRNLLDHLSEPLVANALVNVELLLNDGVGGPLSAAAGAVTDAAQGAVESVADAAGEAVDAITAAAEVAADAVNAATELSEATS